MTSTRTISTEYNLESTRFDFVDLDFNDDIRLYVDPLLFWRSPHRIHHIVHARLLGFFEKAIRYVNEGKTSKAENMCVFPEPENFLGKSSSGHFGHGLSEGLGKKVFDEIVKNEDIQKNGLTFINELQLMIFGVHNDLISDMTVNIVKDYFVWYTGQECKYWDIPLHETGTRMFLHDEDEWDEVRVKLPINPVKNTPFILTPRILVRREISYNYKDFYKQYLRYILRENVERTRLLGLGKPAKVSWKEVEEEFPPKKDFIVSTIHEKPEMRKEFADQNTPERLKFSLKATSEKLNLATNVYEDSKDALDALLQEENLSKELKTALQHLKGGFAAARKEEVYEILDSFNNMLAQTRDSLVVILGSYTDGESARFESAKQYIRQSDYEPCVIKDMPDIGNPNLRQKLLMYCAVSRFVIVLDFVASGHLTEIELLKDLGIPIAILSSDEKGSTYMLAGLDTAYSFVRRFVLDGEEKFEETLDAIIDWSEVKIKQDQGINEEQLPWLKRK